MKHLILISILTISLISCGGQSPYGGSTKDALPGSTVGMNQDTVINDDGGGDFGGGDYHSEKLSIEQADKVITKAYRMLPNYLNGLFNAYIQHSRHYDSLNVFEKRPEDLSAKDQIKIDEFDGLGFSRSDYNTLMDEVFPILFKNLKVFDFLKDQELMILKDGMCHTQKGEPKSGSSHIQGKICASAVDLSENFDQWNSFPAALGLLAHELFEKISEETDFTKEEQKAVILQKSLQLFVKNSDYFNDVNEFDKSYYRDNIDLRPYGINFNNRITEGKFKGLRIDGAHDCIDRSSVYKICESQESCNEAEEILLGSQDFRTYSAPRQAFYIVVSGLKDYFHYGLDSLLSSEGLGAYLPFSPDQIINIYKTFAEIQMMESSLQIPYAPENLPGGPERFYVYDSSFYAASMVHKGIYMKKGNCEEIQNPNLHINWPSTFEQFKNICKIKPDFKLQTSLFFEPQIEKLVERINKALQFESEIVESLQVAPLGFDSFTGGLPVYGETCER